MSKQANAGTPTCVRLCACVCVLVRVSISSGIINKLHTCLATENVGLCVWGGVMATALTWREAKPAEDAAGI